MTAKQIVQSVRSMFKSFWVWHQKNLGLMVAAIGAAGRVGVAAIGRAMDLSTAPKHAIKRVDKFLSNRNFDDERAREEFFKIVVGPRKRVLIAVDWTKIRSWSVLVAGVIQRGRAIPVLWSVMDPATVYKSYNSFECGFFTWLAKALPEGVSAVVLLDRGFDRVALTKHLRRCGLSFVIRVGGNVHVHHEDYRGPINELLQRRGEARDLRNAVLRPSRPVRVRVVANWARGQQEPWLLMTDMSLSAEQILASYQKRFRIEETFRDEKAWRFGLALGGLKMFKPDRLDRLLLAVAIFHFLAMMVGGHARREGLDRLYRANTVKHKPTHSDFALGNYYILRIPWNLAKLFQEFYLERVPLFGG
jgi:Transposase DDE domain